MKFLFLVLALTSFAISAQTFSIAKFSIGETRIKLDQSEFKIIKNSDEVNTYFISDSVQWVRNENNLLIPRSLLAIKLRDVNSNYSLRYYGKTIIPVKRSNYRYSELYVDLFNPGEIEIFRDSNLIDKITIQSLGTKDAKSKQLIDYSCASYNLSIEGIDSEYLSVGCKMEKTGNLLKQMPRLEVTISSTNLKTLNNQRPPFTIYLVDNSPVEFKVLNSNNEEETIKLSATLPKRMTRMKLALGLGPYAYNSANGIDESKNNLAPSFMIYGKFDLTETSSLKAFDALIYSKSFFNNSGLYFSYDLAEVFDGRILINTLLGFQGINYSYKNSDAQDFAVLYPQGFEFIYKHAFGNLNKNLTFGMFLSTTSEVYTNAWIRYGGRVFYEINYIDWASKEFEGKKISMVGLSIGFPIFEAF